MNKCCVIIIPCNQLNSYVIEALDGCLKLDYGNFHIALLPDYQVNLPKKYLCDSISVLITGNCTISTKRNNAIHYFKNADYFALIDSDAYPDPQWIANGIGFLEKNPDVWAIGGPNITPPQEPLNQRAVGNALQTFFVSGPLYFTKSRSKSRYCNNLHSCNLILSRQTFELLGDFDETLFTGEDRNLCDRIRAAGKKIYFHQDVVVYHHNRSLWLPFLLQRLTYGYCSRDISKNQFHTSNLLLFLPLAWLVLFLVIMLFDVYISNNYTFSRWFITINLVAAFILAAISAQKPRELPLTIAAILVSYAGMTIGQILAFSRIRLNLKRIYSNSPSVVYSNKTLEEAVKQTT